MAMEKVYEELEEVKFENEKLRSDLKSKAELYEHLKKFQNEQSTKLHEASSKIEKQAQQVLEKEEKISVVTRTNEDLKCNLKEKESIIKHLNAANDKLRAERDGKNQKREQEIGRLVLALDEANEKSIDQEQKMDMLKAEIEGLKAHLLVSQKKHSEAEKKAKNQKDQRERDDVLVKVEEDMKKVEHQLKWKKEQFKHLEEAHDRLRNQFKESEKEWEKEKCTLFDEISSLQTRLDSQIRITGDLQSRLQMCNQALAHEETRRKYLEVEISEFKTRFERSFAECQDAKSHLECLNSQRDKEVATLRHLLGTKESFYKEMEYRVVKLEQENQELLASLKELQETRIQEAGNSSLSKLKNKLKSVEQLHKDCSSNLRTKEAEWNSEREEMMKKLNDYSSQLKTKDAALNVLEMELESCLSSAVQLKLQNEEISIMMVLLKTGMFEAQLKLANAEAELGLHQKEGMENLSVLRQQLEMKNTALANAQRDITEERQRNAILSRKVDTLAQLEDKHQLMEKEVNTCKTILKESSKCQLRLKEQALQMETDSKEKIREVCDALDVANSQLAEEREKVASLLSRVESLDLIEGQRFLVQKELERYKERLEEASRRQIHLEEQALQREIESKEKLSEVCNALEAAKSELSKERERAVSLTKRVESLDHLEEQWLQKQDEVERYKKMLEEACRSQSQLEDQVGHMKKEFGEKLEAAFNALETVKSELAKERERTASLMKRVEQWALRQKDLDKYKERFEESYRCQLQLEEKISQIERDSERKLTEACNALEKANSELVEKVCKGHEIEFESWIWKSISERLKVDLEESQELRKQLEASLLAQVGVGEIIKKEIDDLIRITKEKDQEILSLQQHMVTLEQELQARELRAMETDSKEKIREVCDALDVANSQLAEEREKVASLLSRVESLDLIEGQRFLVQKELERYKERLEEASRRQIHLEEQALQREIESKEKLSEVCNALEAAKSELSKERERAVSLTKRVESLDHLEEQWLQKQDEVERYKKMLEEACRSQSQLEDQVGHMKKEFGEKLEAAFNALETVKSELAKERERTASLMKRVEQWALRQKDLDKYKERFEESYRCQLQLEEKISQIERDSERKLTEACNALEKANSELVEKVCKGHEIEFESWIWKSISERLKVDLEESRELRKQLEASLLAQVGVGQGIKKEKDDLIRITKEKDQEILSLQQHMVTLEQELQARELRAVSSAEDSILQITREHDRVLEDLRREIDLLEEESLKLEGAAYAHIGAERSFVREKENILQLVKEKDERIDGLMQVVRSMEEDFNGSLNSFSSELTEKQEHIKLVHEAWEQIASAEILAKLEIEEKKLMIAELEDDIHYIQEKLFSQEKSLSDSKQLALTIEAELEAKHLEMKNLTDQMEERLRTSEASVDELRTEKANLLEDIMKLSTERDNLVGCIGGLNDSLGEFSSEDAQLMRILGRIVQSFDLSDTKGSNELYDCPKENKRSLPASPATKKTSSIFEERSPFRQLN
ncbi:hypothetical protein GOBAR_AA03061 [Gossypium barbadense]|uniref:G protein gamma domain-containing protein n=1 Tax=Gossypium barbadense TaxID=3634 RepID=A0A2P5YPJ7_GOSBA|nr:hypothetical protein GOBAR_AA03061 [Gossypium barbadense]